MINAGSVTPLRNVVVLLTACINPGGVINTARSDPIERLEDYKQALKEWCLHSGDVPIVFCENSGYELNELRAIARENTRSGKSVELLSFSGQDFPPCLGKGYGEMRIIRYALEKSKLIKPDSIVIKITGRLFVKNNRQLIERLSLPDTADVYCDLRFNMTSSDSRVFCATGLFLERYLLPRCEHVNDSTGDIFEKVLAKAIHAALADGWQWSMLPSTPWMVGVAATANKPIPDSRMSVISRELFRRLKKAIVAR